MQYPYNQHIVLLPVFIIGLVFPIDVVCDIFIFNGFLLVTVNKKGDVPETVQKVLKQEMDKLYHGKDAKTLNNEFMERNNNSILHRLAGLSQSMYLRQRYVYCNF